MSRSFQVKIPVAVRSVESSCSHQMHICVSPDYEAQVRAAMRIAEMSLQDQGALNLNGRMQRLPKTKAQEKQCQLCKGSVQDVRRTRSLHDRNSTHTAPHRLTAVASVVDHAEVVVVRRCHTPYQTCNPACSPRFLSKEDILPEGNRGSFPSTPSSLRGSCNRWASLRSSPASPRE